ncbi:MAG: hypothetical protein J6Y85_02235 [Alphaproteobacteria bacterium]|nr:hypothetical protein [Alphaproteobacteria bacterium]
MNTKKIAFTTLMIGTILYATSTLAGSCTKQGSSVSIATIQSKYKNCVNCGTQKNGNKTVYYCYCGDGCKNSGNVASSVSNKISNVANSTETSTSSKKILNVANSVGTNSSSNTNTSSCSKQGSHISASYIRDHYKNCNKCWSEDVKAGQCKKNKKAHKHYYCNCGAGCLKNKLQKLSK